MRILVLGVLISIAGCASPLRTPDDPPGAATPPALTQGSAAPVAAAASEHVDDFEPPPGFKARFGNGETIYCRKTVVLGSRFPKEMCLTEAQLKDFEANNDSMRRNKDEASRVCANPAACGGE
jgi:hypothetical protein